MSHRVLVIEDDPELGPLLSQELQNAGYRVRWAQTGVAGLTMIREDEPDAIVLDLGLPDLEGEEILRRVRATSEAAVLILTAAHEVGRKVAVLREGADDYLTKPFYFAELLARLEAILRRAESGRKVRVGELELDRVKKLACFQGQPLDLSPREFEIAALLATRPGRVFSRREIAEALWGTHTPKSNTIDVHVAKLRAKLIDAGATGYLRTVRGVGYALSKPR